MISLSRGRIFFGKVGRAILCIIVLLIWWLIWLWTEGKTLKLMPVKQTEAWDGSQRQINHRQELLFLIGALEPVVSSCRALFGMVRVRVEDSLEKNSALKIFSIKILQTCQCPPGSWSCVAVCVHNIVTGPLDHKHLFAVNSNQGNTLKWADITNEYPWCDSLSESFQGLPTESKQRTPDLPYWKLSDKTCKRKSR